MTTFYLDFDNGTDLYRDWSINDRTFTATTVSLDGNIKKFGNYSLDTRSGTTSTSLVTATGSGFQFGAGQFTVEGWCYWDTHSSTAVEALITMWGATQLGWYFAVNNEKLQFGYSTTGADALGVSSTYTPPTGQWVHLAADRDASNVLRIYANGVVIASATVAATFFASTQAIYIGNVNGNGWKFPGFIGEVRVTKGAARYAGAFTPPTAAFPRTALTDPYWSFTASGVAQGVALLLQFDGNGTGTTFKDRFRTFTSGATSARIAAGDEIRIMGSPDPTLVGNATWTQYSKNVVLASAVTANISTGDTAWTPSTNVTAAVATTTFKEGTGSTSLNIAAAFTTGKVAHFATGTLDLSPYQQVSFWIQNSVAVAAGTFELRLCSDTAGVTAVHTVPIPAIPSTAQFVPLTVDTGAALSTSIGSIALYANVDPGALTVLLDNIIACKASSDPASLTLNSLIGKVCNLSWAASTAYSTGDERRPTQPMRNGFRCKATTGGTTGSTEPTWPQEIGVTVMDGTVVWTCVGLEDTWFPIQSINGTTVKVDNTTNTLGNAGRGYAGATETVATYKRETIKPGMTSSATTGYINPQKAGTVSAPLSVIGGWDRTSMASQSMETWLDGQNGLGFITGNYSSQLGYQYFENISGTRAGAGNYNYGSFYSTLKNCHFPGCGSGIAAATTVAGMSLMGVNVSNCSTGVNGAALLDFNAVRALTADSAIGSNINLAATGGTAPNFIYAYINARNSGAYGFVTSYPMDTSWSNLTTANNVSGGLFVAQSAKTTLYNSSLTDTTPFVLNTLSHAYVYSQKHQQTADNHVITTDGGTIVSAIDQRHTLSGIAWKFRPAATSRNSAYPLKLSIAKIACAANVAVTITIWTRRDNTSITGRLKVAGGQIAGVPVDLIVVCTPAINTWTISGTLSFTPSETGVVEVIYECFDGTLTTSSMWIDDISIS